MTDHNMSSRLRHGASLAMLAGAAMFFAGPAPASAQQSSWEIGCAYKSLPTGSGEAQRTLNCDRQKQCQQMANARGATIVENGCFFIQPSAQPPLPQAGGLRPTQQQ